jgi:hypothetical protein
MVKGFRVEGAIVLRYTQVAGVCTVWQKACARRVQRV